MVQPESDPVAYDPECCRKSNQIIVPRSRFYWYVHASAHRTLFRYIIINWGCEKPYRYLSGNFTTSLPNSWSLEEAQVWIGESISRRRLHDQYVILGLRNLTRATNDGQSLFAELERWPRYNSTIGAYL